MVKAARIQPFKGLCYNPAKIAYENVIAPPYDVISDRQKKALEERSPYNIVRLILGARDESPERYERVKTLLNNWIHEGVFRFDTKPAVYFYIQDYDLEDGSRLTRKGFIALCKLESFSSGKISPHEMTHKKQIDDRLMLLRASQANLSPIFSLYSDPNMTINETFMAKHQDDPLLDTTDEDNVRHRFYRVTDPEALSLAVKVLSEKKLLIADGHHRYATALAYRNEMRKVTGNSSGQAPFDYVMMYFTNTHDKGLTFFFIRSCATSIKVSSFRAGIRRIRLLSSGKSSSRPGTLERMTRVSACIAMAVAAAARSPSTLMASLW